MTAPASAMPPPRTQAPECRFCSSPLTPHQAVRGICASPGCQARSVQEAARLVFRRDWHAYVEEIRGGIESAAGGIAAGVRMLGVEPEAVTYGVVPRQNHAVVPLPAARYAAFARHLDEIITGAFEDGAPEPDLARREAAERPEQPLALSACATCQGKCCFLGGGTHAFLDSATIRLFRARNPGATREEIRARYLSHLPEQSVEHSCPYHGPLGCTLPRSERADICNRYHCQMQSDLLRRFRDMRAEAAVIVASDHSAAPAVAVHDGSGWHPVPVGSAPAPEDAGRVAHVAAVALAQQPRDLPEEVATQPPRDACAWCGTAIDRHDAATHRSCGRPACERKRIAEAAEGVRQRKHAQHAALVRQIRHEIASGLGVAAAVGPDLPAGLVLGVVPMGSDVLAPVPAERRAALERHLERLAAEGFGAMPPNDPADAAARPEPPLVVAACATCRGHCCRGGGDTGYLSAEQALRFRRRAPEAGAQEFRDRYLDLVPELSVEGSCIYNGANGCTLPRELRSDICNGYRCHGLSALLKDAGEARDAMIVAVDERQRPRRAARFDGRTGTPDPVREIGDGAG